MQRELEQAQRGGEGPATVAYDPDDVGGWDPGVDAGVPLGRQGGQRAPAAPSGPPQGRIVGGFGGKPQGRTGGREQSTDISSRQKQYLLQDEEGGPFYSAPLPAGFKWALDDVDPVDPARPPLRPLIAANTPIHEIIAKSAELRAARQQEEGGGFRSANSRQKPMFSSDLKEPLAELEIDGRVPSATLDRDVFLRDANGQSLRTSVRALLSGVLSRDDSGVLLGQLPASRQADVLNAAIELGQARGFDQRFDDDPSAIQRQGRVVDMPAASTWDLGLVNVKGEPVLDATGRQRFVKVNSGMPFADVEVDPDQTAAHNRLRTETYGNEIANIQHNSRTPVKTIAALEAMGGVLREPTAQERARLAPRNEGVDDTLAYIHELGDKKTPIYKYASAGRTEGAQGAESMGDGNEGLYRIGSPTKYNSRQMFGQLSDFVMGGRREILPRRDIVQGDELVTVPAGTVVPALFHPDVRVRLAEERRLSQLAGRKVTAYGVIDELAGGGFALPPEPSPYSNERSKLLAAVARVEQGLNRKLSNDEVLSVARRLGREYSGAYAAPQTNQQARDNIQRLDSYLETATQPPWRDAFVRWREGLAPADRSYANRVLAEEQAAYRGEGELGGAQHNAFMAELAAGAQARAQGAPTVADLATQWELDAGGVPTLDAIRARYGNPRVLQALASGDAVRSGGGAAGVVNPFPGLAEFQRALRWQAAADAGVYSFDGGFRVPTPAALSAALEKYQGLYSAAQEINRARASQERLAQLVGDFTAANNRAPSNREVAAMRSTLSEMELEERQGRTADLMQTRRVAENVAQQRAATREAAVQAALNAKQASYEQAVPQALRRLDAELGTPEHDAFMRALARNAQVINEDRARPLSAQEYEYAAPLENVPRGRRENLLRQTYAAPSTLSALAALPAPRGPEAAWAERYLQDYAQARRRAEAFVPATDFPERIEIENLDNDARFAQEQARELGSSQFSGALLPEGSGRQLSDDWDAGNPEALADLAAGGEAGRKPDLSRLENLDDADVDRLEEQGLPGYTDPNALARPAGLSDFERRVDSYLQRLGVSAQGARQRPAHIPAHLWPKFVEQAQWAVERGYDRA
jgi:hypothetical protein